MKKVILVLLLLIGNHVQAQFADHFAVKSTTLPKLDKSKTRLILETDTNGQMTFTWIVSNTSIARGPVTLNKVVTIPESKSSSKSITLHGVWRAVINGELTTYGFESTKKDNVYTFVFIGADNDRSVQLTCYKIN